MNRSSLTPEKVTPEFDTGNTVCHVGTRAAGALLGLTLAYFLLKWPFDFSRDLEKARELGIVSLTILANYPARQDLLTYAAVLGLPILCGGLLWGAVCRRRGNFRVPVVPEAVDPGRVRKHWRWWAGACATLVVLTAFDINLFVHTSYSTAVGGWVLLGEEGASLAWAQSILHGGVYGKDFFCLYGPLMVYPLAWLMHLFGEHILVERVLKFALDIIGYGIVMAAMYRSVRHRGIFVAGSLLLPAVFPAVITVSLNFTFLRSAVGLLPVLLVYVYLLRRRRSVLLLAGGATGAAVLFSQEAGLCAVIACVAMVALDRGMQGRWRCLAGELALATGAGAAVTAPMVGYFAVQGALPALIDNLVGYPRLVTLGYGNLIFPSFQSLLTAPLVDDRFAIYAPIFVFILAALHLLPRWVERDRTPILLFQTGLLVFGMLLFRLAIGRSGLPYVMRVMPTVWVLGAILVDRAWTAMEAARSPLLKVPPAGLVATLAAIAVLTVASSPFLQQNGEMFFKRNAWHPDKWRVVPGGETIDTQPRISGIRFHPECAQDIRTIGAFINEATGPNDDVYFFPGEAAYYFIFDRRIPTRYVLSYFAVTSQQRKDLIADLDRRRPRYVVYSRNTYRIDHIPETVQEREEEG